MMLKLTAIVETSRQLGAGGAEQEGEEDEIQTETRGPRKGIRET